MMMTSLLLSVIHLEHLEKHKYKEIAKALDVTEQHVQEIADIISSLDPRPARQYRETAAEYIIARCFCRKS